MKTESTINIYEINGEEQKGLDRPRLKAAHHRCDNCDHKLLEESEVYPGECACGCRDYRMCPACEMPVEVNK